MVKGNVLCLAVIKPIHNYFSLTISEIHPVAEVLNNLGMVSAKSLSFQKCATIQFSSQLIRSEEHTSELQSHSDLVCRLLLEKKKTI